MRKRVIYAVVAPTCMLAFAGPAFRASDDGAIRLHARLTGFQEVTPKLTSATGDFTAVIDPTRTSITFTLTYSPLSSPVLFSHIHFGQPGVNGGVMVFFCTNTTPPPNVPPPAPCPSPGGTVSGTLTAADVVGLNSGTSDQGITPGSLDDVIRAIVSGQTYVNVHSQRWGGGEIRGRVRVRADDEQH